MISLQLTSWRVTLCVFDSYGRVRVGAMSDRAFEPSSPTESGRKRGGRQQSWGFGPLARVCRQAGLSGSPATSLYDLAGNGMRQ